VGVVRLAGGLVGLWLAGPAVLLAGWHLVRAPRPRLLIAGAAAVLAAVPVVWLVLRPDTGNRITARIVLDDPWPGRLAALGLLLLAIGVLRAERDVPTDGADRADGDRGGQADVDRREER
jgi:hypothetical protein